MSDKMEISATETGVVRVFHLDLPPEAVERFTTQAGTGEWPMPYSLGATKLREAYVDVVSVRDLGEMPLSTYLAEAYGLSGADFKQARGQLDSLRGHVVVLPSTAFGGEAQTLTVSSPLRWVGTFSEETRPASLSKLRSKSAKGNLSAPAPEDETEASPNTAKGKSLWLILGGLFVVILLLFFLAR